jgi:hypothetical protein
MTGITCASDVGRGGVFAHHSDSSTTKGVIGGRNGAAARLGLPRTTLVAKMQRLGCRKDIVLL